MRHTIARRPMTATLIAALAAATCALCLSSTNLAAKGKPGGGGGGNEPPANIAFVYADTNDGGLFTTTSDGATTTRLTKPPRGYLDYGPVWSPDQDADPATGYQGVIAFVRKTDNADVSIHTVLPDGSGEGLVYDLGGGANLSLTWSPDGQDIVVVSDGDVWFIDRFSGNAEIFPVQYGVGGGAASFSIDLDPGTAGYQGYLGFVQNVAGITDGADIVLLEVSIDVSGSKSFGPLTPLNLPNHQEEPRFSPVGLSIAFTNNQTIDHTDQTNVAVLDVGFDAAGLPVIVGGEFLADIVSFPSGYTWSPDGMHIGWDHTLGFRSREIARIRADGSDNGLLTFVTDTRRATEWTVDWHPGWLNDIDFAP